MRSHWRENGEVKHHVYVKRQTRICTTWPSFPFTCRLLFIISSHKLVVSRNFLSIRIVLSCFYLLIFYFEKFSTWIWRLPFAIYVKLKPSNDLYTHSNKTHFQSRKVLHWASFWKWDFGTLRDTIRLQVPCFESGEFLLLFRYLWALAQNIFRYLCRKLNFVS